MIPEQQRFWIALLNLARTWTSDETALALVPPRLRDFESAPEWPQARALAWLGNHVDLLRDAQERLAVGDVPDLDAIGQVLAPLRLVLDAPADRADVLAAARRRHELGGRYEVLRAEADLSACNPGTRHVRHTIQRAFFYFAQYVDERLSDPLWPQVSAGRWHVGPDPLGSGDLVLVPPRSP